MTGTLVDTASFTPNEVYLISANEFIQGAAAGAAFNGNGNANEQAQQLADRTAYLYNWAAYHPYYAIDTGTVNNIVVSLNAGGLAMNAISSLSQLIGVEINVLIANTNTSAQVVFQANGLGYVPVTLGLNGLGVDPGVNGNLGTGGGPLRAGRFAKFMYHGTSFQLLAAPPVRLYLNGNSPPLSDILLLPGDEISQSFTSMTSVPLHIQTQQGVYEFTMW